MPNKWCKLNEDVYLRDIYFFYCEETYALSTIKRLFGLTDVIKGGWGWHWYHFDETADRHQSFIWIKPDTSLRFYDTLLHELSHCMHRMYDCHGVRYDSDNDEHYCWHIGALFRQCVEFVRKNKLRKCV